MRRFEFQEGKSNKFWEIDLQGDGFQVRWGKLGTQGQSQTKSFPNATKAQTEHDKLIAEKLAKGYTEVGAPAPVAVATVASSPKPAPPVTLPPTPSSSWPDALKRKVHPYRGFESARPKPDLKKVAARLTEVRGLVRAQPGNQATIDRWKDINAVPADPITEARVAALMGINDMTWPRAEEIGSDLVHHWVAHRGVVYAAETLATSFATMADNDGKLLPNKHPEYLTLGPWKTLRAYLAVDPDHETARQAVERFWGDAPLGLAVALAYAFPDHHEWVRSALERGWLASQSQHNNFPWALNGILASVFELGQLERFVAQLEVYPMFERVIEFLPTAVQRVGPESAGLLMRLLKLESKTDEKRVLAGLLATVRSAEVAEFMAGQLNHKVLGPIAQEYLASAKDLAAPLVENARGSAAAALQSRLQEAPVASGPEADGAELPRVLAAPPWLHPVKAAPPLVIKGLEPIVEGETIHWKQHERERIAHNIRARKGDLRQLLRDRKDLDPDHLFGVEDGAEIFNTTPSEKWNVYMLGSEYSNYPAQLLARFGPEVIPGLIQSANVAQSLFYRELARVESPRLAWFYADAWARLKKFRKLGAQWLQSYPQAAALGLIPVAVGPTGKTRDAASQALRYVASRGHRGVIEQAADRYGAREAVAQVLDYDTLQEVPSKLPVRPAWLNPAALPRPVLKNGKAVPVEPLLTMLRFSPLDPPYPGIEQVAEACTPGSLEDFSWALFQAWLHAGANSKEAWAYHALAHLGGDQVARELTPLLRRWPGEGFSTRAAEGLGILGAIGTDVALMHLHGIAQKLRYKALQDKAREKIEQIAEARGLTLEELADRLVPDLDLDEDGSRLLDFGPRQFRVGFDHELRPYVKDVGELPKPAKTDDAAKAAEAVELWRALKKDAKTVARQQVLRLETAMARRRRWDKATFETFLARHPLACHLVRRLVWGVYAADKLQTTFRVAEDGSYADSTDKSFALPDGASVGVAHPLEFDPSLWAGLFGDYQILQPFPQLARPVFKLDPAESKAREKQFPGLTVPSGSVLGMEDRGWRRGYVESGVVCELQWPTSEGDATLTFDPGVWVGGINENPTQSDFKLSLPHGTFFGRLEPIELSEVLYAVERLR